MIGQIRWRRWCIAAALGVLAICAAGLPGLSINSDTRVFFSDSNEHRAALAAFEARYARKTSLLIALHAHEGTVFTEERLGIVRRLTDEAWLLPYATRVESIANFSEISSDDAGVVIDEMIPADTEVDVASVQKRVLTDPLLVNKLISPNGKTTILNVTVDYPMGQSAVVNEIQEAASALVAAEVPDEAGLEVWYGGRVASSLAFSTAAKNDLATLTGSSYVLIFVLLMVVLRRWSVALALFSTALLSAVAALGVAGWAGLQLNAATSNTPTVIIGLTVAALLHLVTTTLQILRKGDERELALSKAVRKDFLPVSLTFATTAIGFLTLNWADAPPFQELGNVVATGCFFGWLFGFLWLPAILSYTRMEVLRDKNLIASFVAWVASGIIRSRRILVAVTGVLAVVLLGGIARIEIDDNYVKYFDGRFDYRHHADAIQDNVVGLDVIEFDIDSGQSDGIFEPEYIKKIAAFEAWAKAQPKVDFVASICEVLRRVHQHMHGGSKDHYHVPMNREVLAQYLLLYEMSLPYGQSLNDTVTIDHDRSRVTVVMREASTRDVREFKEAADQWLAQRAPKQMAGVGTGLAVMYAYLSSLNIKTMTGGTFAALALISLILVFAFRSVRYGMLSLVPNLLPAALGFGVWGYVVGEAGVAVSAVGAVTLGIIVDDTIHMVWRYKDARDQGQSPENALRQMFAMVGEPMLINSMILIVAFCVLILSGFHITVALGSLAATTILLALVFDWLLFAPLLVLLDRGGSSSDVSAEEGGGGATAPA